jgi:hypothetical protein
MWHTHMLSSISGYNSDCKALMGSTLHHDDSLNDRTPGGILDQSYQSTKQMWLDEFGEEYVVEGGMYRGEPPAAYFSRSTPTVDWKGVVLPSIIPLMSVCEMGASSTSPNAVPTKWAVISVLSHNSTAPTFIGLTSDGSPAFIAPTKTGNRELLRGEKHKENYILGKVNNIVGFYHVETKEAYIIMKARLVSRTRQLASEIAMEKCCCGNRNPKGIARKEAELEKIKEVYAEITQRSQASKPSGVVGKSSTTSDGVGYYDSRGLWLYPPVVWDSCGGACGGQVVYSSPGGAAACGAGGCGGECPLLRWIRSILHFFV